MVRENTKTIFTFDVELFFGDRVGTAENNIFKPVYELIDLAKAGKFKATFFIDAGHVHFLEKYRAKYGPLDTEYRNYVKLIHEIEKQGHDIQLHIHPHWEDARWENEWLLDMKRYGISSFSQYEYIELFKRYKNTLDNIIGKKTYAFRAGGFCVQGKFPIGEVLKSNDIEVDSSVYFGGHESSATHYFDFRDIPEQEFWKFERDPTKIDDNGAFYEIPISSFRFRPYDFIQIWLKRHLNSDQARAFGDGVSSKMSLMRKMRYLTMKSFAVDSVDYGKSEYLGNYVDAAEKCGRNMILVIGHPKALSRISLSNIAEYVKIRESRNIVSLSQYYSTIAGAK